jgi:pimeloyl-ACP methyl ester carboxylesterase
MSRNPMFDTGASPVSTLVQHSKARRRSAAFCAVLLAVALAPAAGSAQTLQDVKAPATPLVLKQQGSFFVGGKQVHTDAAGWDQANALPQYGSGDITVDQMYVQFQIPQRQKHAVPLVFVHGCCLSSKTWETTPDGRMGWYEYFTRQGFATYLGEQAGRARSGFDGTVFNQVRSGALPPGAQPPVLLGTAQFAWDVFRFGPTFGTPWPDEQFPMHKVNQLYKQVIPDMILTLVPDLFAELGDPGDRLPTVREMSLLAKDLGGAVLIGHSQSSGFPTKAALHDPTGVRGIIGLETGCFGNLDAGQIATLSKIPILIVVGDHFGVQPPPSCVTEMQQINDAGGDMTFISLPDIGIHGNSHMFMQDKNNLQVAKVLIDWIKHHVEAKELARR